MDIDTAYQIYLQTDPRPSAQILAMCDWDDCRIRMVLEDVAAEWGIPDETVIELRDRAGTLTHYVWTLPPEAWAEAQWRIWPT
jgi:hypothetical protein